MEQGYYLPGSLESQAAMSLVKRTFLDDNSGIRRELELLYDVGLFCVEVGLCLRLKGCVDSSHSSYDSFRDKPVNGRTQFGLKLKRELL